MPTPGPDPESLPRRSRCTGRWTTTRRLRCSVPASPNVRDAVDGRSGVIFTESSAPTDGLEDATVFVVEIPSSALAVLRGHHSGKRAAVGPAGRTRQPPLIRGRSSRIGLSSAPLRWSGYSIRRSHVVASSRSPRVTITGARTGEAPCRAASPSQRTLDLFGSARRGRRRHDADDRRAARRERRSHVCRSRRRVGRVCPGARCGGTAVPGGVHSWPRRHRQVPPAADAGGFARSRGPGAAARLSRHRAHAPRIPAGGCSRVGDRRGCVGPADRRCGDRPRDTPDGGCPGHLRGVRAARHVAPHRVPARAAGERAHRHRRSRTSLRRMAHRPGMGGACPRDPVGRIGAGKLDRDAALRLG